VQLERSFTIEVDSEVVLRRLGEALPAMGYRQVGSDPLQFKRGSRIGRWFATSHKDFETKVTAKLTPPTIDKITKVNLQLIIPQIHDDKWSRLSRKALNLPSTQFWDREIEIIEAIARGVNHSMTEQYNAEMRTEATQNFIIFCFVAVVLCAALALLWFINSLGVALPNYLWITFIGVFLLTLISIIYNARNVLAKNETSENDYKGLQQ